MVGIEHLPPQFAQGAVGTTIGPAPVEGSAEKVALIEALRQTNGNQTQAARCSASIELRSGTACANMALI